MDLIRITPDKERAKSIINMISLIEERIKIQDRKRMSALIIADYYEIIKELATAVLLIEGYKTLSHRDLIDYLSKNCKEFTSQEIFAIDNLRVLRNRISYEGFSVEPAYLNRNETMFKELISKLKNLIARKLG